jgi:enamidase
VPVVPLPRSCSPSWRNDRTDRYPTKAAIGYCRLLIVHSDCSHHEGASVLRVAIYNVGRILTGDLTAPEGAGDVIVCTDGRIEFIGATATGSFDVEIDARGTTAVPGLIDSHIHTTFGDYTPRQQAVGYLASYVHGGITTAISASEVHVPGRPTSASGLVALAVAAHQTHDRHRPGGMRVHGGSLILDPVLTADELARARAGGVWLVKAGFGAVETPFDYAPLVAEARRLGMVTTLHVGGASIPGSAPVTGEHVLAIQPDVAFHCNGGPVAMADADYERVLAESRCALQLCTAGNLRTTLAVATAALARGEADRVILGTDTPTGSGLMPLGLWYTITHLAALAGVDPCTAVAWGTGTTAAVYALDSGRLALGLAADLLLIDAPLGASRNDPLAAIANGDVPGIGAVLTDGVPRFVGRSRNSPPPTRTPVVTENRVPHDFASTHP